MGTMQKLTKQQIDYELRHFRSGDRKAEATKRALEALSQWRPFINHDSKFENALEVGCGPFGGCLPWINATEKTAIDPLIHDYIDAGLQFPEDITAIVTTFDQYDPPDYHDLVICHNVLEHGNLGFHDLKHLKQLLLPGGMLALLESLRKPSQLNEAHDHALTIEGLTMNLTGWMVNIIRTVDANPPDYDYPRVVAVLERP